MIRIQKTQRGFVMVAAIFLLVVLAALGGFMVTFSNTEQLTSAQDVQGSRAYLAARAGVEWAAGSIKATSGCAGPPIALDGFTLSVTCANTTHDEGGITRTIFKITAVAIAGTSVGSVGYIERSLSASMEK